MIEISYGGTLESIKEKLKKYTLSNYSYFEECPEWLNKEAEKKYKGCASACGGFEEIPNPFHIITDDKKIIAELKGLFEGNRKK